MDDFLGICAVRSGSEREAREEIERLGYGVRMLTYRASVYRRGRRYVQVRPLMPGYLFPRLRAGWGEISEIDGVKVLTLAEKPLCVSSGDADRLDALERHCILGDFNKVQHQPSSGRTKQKKRRRRPRRGKIIRNFTRVNSPT